jgi:hypothetical protein
MTESKRNQKWRLDLVPIFAVLTFGFCILSYSAKSQDAKTMEKSITGKENVEDVKRTSFEEIYEHLDSEMREKLQKSVTLIFTHTKVDQVIMHLSKQIGVNITASGISERIDCVYQNMPAATALKTLSKDKSWHWEKSGSAIHIYQNPIPVSVYLKFEEFCKSLDEETVKKLNTPVTLIFANTKLEEILQQMSKQVGITAISKGIDTRLDIIQMKTPAISILENLVKTYSWKLEMIDNVIVITPISQGSSGEKVEESDTEIVNMPVDARYIDPKGIPDLRLRFYLFKILVESTESFKEKISESCQKGDFETRLKEWEEKKSLSVIGAPVILKKGTQPAKMEITGGDVEIRINIYDMKAQDDKIHTNATVSFANNASGTTIGMEFSYVKEGKFYLFSSKEGVGRGAWHLYAAVCKVEKISYPEPGVKSEQDERIQAHREKIDQILEQRKKEQESTP